MNSENNKNIDSIAYQKFSSGLYEEAIKICEKAIELKNNSSYTFFLLGCCEYALKNYSSGISFLSKALELDRECIYFSERAKCKYEIGDYESAIDDLTYAICLRRDRRYNYYWMAHCKYELKDYKGAIEELNIGINLENEIDNDTCKSFLFWLRADCKYILDDYLSAINDCDKSIEINSENSYFYFLRAECKYELKNYDGALLDIEKALNLNQHKHNEEIIYLRAYIKGDLGDLQGEMEDLDEVININSSDPDYFQRRGLLKMILNKYQSAINDFDQALKLNPKDLISSRSKFHCSEAQKAKDMIDSNEIKKVKFIIYERFEILFKGIHYPYKKTEKDFEIFVILDDKEFKKYFSESAQKFCANIFNLELAEGCFGFEIFPSSEEELIKYKFMLEEIEINPNNYWKYQKENNEI